MKKTLKKIINKYNDWVVEGRIYTQWESEDYENTTVYENINGDVIAIKRNDEGNIVDAWEG